MSTVTPLTRLIDRELIKKLFQKFSGVYGNLWNSRCATPEDWNECVIVWLDGLKGFEFDVLRKAVTQSFIAHKDYPPTLGQLVDICLHVSGVPSEGQIIDLMIRRDFNHPLVKAVYDKIGNWILSNEKPEQVKAKVRAVYSESLTWFRENTDKAWAQLDSFKEQKALPEPPPKIPTQSEIMGWRERMAQYQEKSKIEKLRLGAVAHPEWPRDQLAKNGKGFDEKVFNEYKRYLISVDEELAITLPMPDRYDRICFLREIEASQHLERVGYVGKQEQPVKNAPRSFNGAKAVYKTWMND